MKKTLLLASVFSLLYVGNVGAETFLTCKLVQIGGNKISEENREEFSILITKDEKAQQPIAVVWKKKDHQAPHITLREGDFNLGDEAGELKFEDFRNKRTYAGCVRTDLHEFHPGAAFTN